MAAPAGPSSAARPPRPIVVEGPITVGQFVKLAALAATGGDAKRLVVSGLVRVNGVVEMRRGHKLSVGDVVDVGGDAARVTGPGSDAARAPNPHDSGAAQGRQQ
jgi:ribosome-associated protein